MIFFPIAFGRGMTKKMKQHQISIIIPILNEADTIGKLLQYLTANSSEKNIAEIIIVDGESTDGSKKIINNFVLSSDSVESELYREGDDKGLDTFQQSENTRSVILLLNSAKGRAKQMNIGAKSASGNILYFLHADSCPPKHFDTDIIQEVKKGNEAGCFKMKFDLNHWWLQLAGWLTQFNWRACRGGDQSQFITKTLFEDIGGYDENYIIYEDNILINELFKRKQFVVIKKSLITSSRLYKRVGIWKLQYHFWAIYVKRWFGASPEELHHYYKKNIA